MKKETTKVIGIICAAALIAFAYGCGKKEAGPMEKLGESADTAVSKAADEAKTIGGDIDKALDDTKKKADEAAK